MDQDPPADRLAQVRDAAAAARAFLEPRWQALWAAGGGEVPPGSPASRDMCRFSACFLARVLEAEIPGAGWQVVGGHPEYGCDTDPDIGLPGGCRGAGGLWHGHYWVTDGRWDIMADITADQFGHAAVIASRDDEGFRANYRE